MGRRVILFLALAAAPAVAQPATQPATLPATHPATAPATRPLDLSTPKATLRALAEALRDGGDGRARLRRVILTHGEEEERMVATMADTAAAFGRLHAAAAKAFGGAGAAKFTGDADEQFAQSAARIEAAAVTVDGESAAVRYAGAGDVEYTLLRVGGEWRVPAAQFAHGADAATIDRRAAEMAVQAAVVAELTAEIDAGLYKNADAAYQAWQGKVMHAIGAKPKTQQATRPGG